MSTNVTVDRGRLDIEQRALLDRVMKRRGSAFLTLAIGLPEPVIAALLRGEAQQPADVEKVTAWIKERVEVKPI